MQRRLGTFTHAYGNNRYVRYWPQQWKQAQLSAKRHEIEAWARDRQIPAMVIYEAVQEALRLGRIPDLGGRGLSYDDSEALAHFIKDAFLNMESNDELSTQEKFAILKERLRKDEDEGVYLDEAKKGKADKLLKKAIEYARRFKKTYEFGETLRWLKRGDIEGAISTWRHEAYPFRLGANKSTKFPGVNSPQHKTFTVLLRKLEKASKKSGLKEDFELPVREAEIHPVEKAFVNQFKRLISSRSFNTQFDPDMLDDKKVEENRLKIKSPLGSRVSFEMERLHGDPVRYDVPDPRRLNEV